MNRDTVITKQLDLTNLTPTQSSNSCCGDGGCSTTATVALDSLSNDADQVRTLVRDHYAERVRNQQSCCGSTAIELTTEGDWGATHYSQDELAQAPDEAVNLSYGCGNPTALAALRPGEIVLDLGSGGGLDCFLAARKVGDQGYVYGVDMTDEMLALANRNKAKTGLTNVEFRKGTIEALPLPDESVDTIISNCVINLSPDKAQTLAEAFRVLRPGGRLAISDVVIDGTLDDLPVSEAQLRTALSWAGCIAGALTKAQFTTYLQTVGFEAVSVEITQRHSLTTLGISNATAAELLPPALAEAVAQRFTSSMIYARKPAPIRIDAATPADRPAVEALLHKCALPLDGLADHFATALVARSGDHVVGNVALEVYGDAALLRSVAVYPSLRGSGLGHQLTQAAFALARRHGVHDLYLLTTTADDFFPRFGFQPIARSQVPATVQQSVEFQSACPESALVMHLHLANR